MGTPGSKNVNPQESTGIFRAKLPIFATDATGKSGRNSRLRQLHLSKETGWQIWGDPMSLKTEGALPPKLTFRASSMTHTFSIINFCEKGWRLWEMVSKKVGGVYWKSSWSLCQIMLKQIKMMSHLLRNFTLDLEVHVQKLKYSWVHIPFLGPCFSPENSSNPNPRFMIYHHVPKIKWVNFGVYKYIPNYRPFIDKPILLVPTVSTLKASIPKPVVGAGGLAHWQRQSLGGERLGRLGNDGEWVIRSLYIYTYSPSVIRCDKDLESRTY